MLEPSPDTLKPGTQGARKLLILSNESGFLNNDETFQHYVGTSHNSYVSSITASHSHKTHNTQIGTTVYFEVWQRSDPIDKF